jgi:hypothetical protein
MVCCHFSVFVSSALAVRLEAPTFVLLAANLAQQHATQLLPPINVFRVVPLYEAVKVALSLLVRRAVQLRFSRTVPQGPTFLVDDIVAIGFDRENGPELCQRLRHGDRLRRGRRQCWRLVRD